MTAVPSPTNAAPRTGKVPPGWTKDDVIDLVDGMAKLFPSRTDIFEFLCILMDHPSWVQNVLEPLIQVERVLAELDNVEQLNQDLGEVLELAAGDPDRLHLVLFTLNKHDA